MMSGVPWGYPGQFNNGFHCVVPLAMGHFAAVAPQPVLVADRMPQASAMVDHVQAKTRKVIKTELKKKKKSTRKPPSLIEQALLNVDDGVKAKYEEATSRRLCLESAAYAAVKVPVSLVDSLGKQANALHASVLAFLKVDVESGGGYATRLWPGLLMAAIVGESSDFALEWIRQNRHCHFVPKR